MPPGVTEREYADTQIRLTAIKTVLENRLGASDQYCSTYYESQVGSCMCMGGTCKKHTPNAPTLPPGLMCAREYGLRLSHIQTAMEEKRQEKINCKRDFEALDNEDESNQQENSCDSTGVDQVCAMPCKIFLIYN
jgi:hypothetical protein